MLCCLALMDQAAVLDGLCFDLLPFCEDCRATSEVGVGACQVAEAFVISPMAVMRDEGVDSRLKFALQVTVFQQENDQCCSSRGIWRDRPRCNRAVIVEQPRLVQHGDTVSLSYGLKHFAFDVNRMGIHMGLIV